MRAPRKFSFLQDGFGKFGALDTEEDWACEARRYYFNIVGKYGAQVQALLKKAAGLDIQIICPLHGPILKENLEYYIGKYQVWSSYEPEDEGILIAYASIHGHTAKAAQKLKEILEAKGAKKLSSPIYPETIWRRQLKMHSATTRWCLPLQLMTAGFSHAWKTFCIT